MEESSERGERRGKEDGERAEKESEGEPEMEMLLPRTSNSAELWPVILTKAILKVAALEYV